MKFHSTNGGPDALENVPAGQFIQVDGLIAPEAQKNG